MEIFWGVMFGVLAAVVLIWTVGRVIEAGRIAPSEEFTSSEPDRTHADLFGHTESWERMHEKEDDLR